MPPSGSEWLVLKKFWVDVLSTLAKFTVKYLGSIHSTVEDQLDAFLQIIDVESIARQTSTAPLLALLELILTCGVHCKLKENCVMQVLQLRKDQQAVMMASIQSVKAKHIKPKSSSTSQAGSSSSSVSDADLKARYVALKQAKEQVSGQLQHAQKSNAALADRNNELVTLVTQLEEQLGSMTVDYKHMKAQHDVMTEKKLQEEQKVTGEALDLTSPLRFMASSKVASEENTHLRATVSTHEKTISTLQTQLNALSPYVSKVRELEDEIEMLKEKSRSADQVERITRQLATKSSELTNTLLKVKQLEEALEQAQKTSGEHEAIARQVPQLKAKLDQYKNEMVSLHSKLANASSSRDPSAEIAELHEKLQLYALQCEQHAAIVASLEREKDSLVHAALRAKPTPAAHQDSSATSSKMSLASEARGSLQHLVGKNSKSSEAHAQLEKELSAAKEALETVKMDLEDQLDTMTRLKEKFQADYISSSEQLRAANTEISELNKKVKSLDESLAVSNEEKASSIAERNALQSERTTLQTSLNALNDTVKLLETQKSLSESQMKSLNETLAQTRVENSTLSSETTTLKSEISNLKAQNEQIEARVVSAESQLSAGEDKLVELESTRAADEERFTSRLAEIQAELDSTAEKSSQLADEAELAKTELHRAQNHLEQLSAELSAQQDQCQALAGELDEVKHAKTELDGHVANMEMEHAELEETLQEFMNRELAAVESSLSLQNEVENLNSLIESRDAELTTMQQELEKAKANEELISVIGALRTQVVAQQKVIAAHKDETSAIVASYHRLGMELLHYKIGGIPQPESVITTTFAPLSSPRRAVKPQTPKSRASPKSKVSVTSKTSPNSKLTPSKRLPLREQQMNHLFSQGLQVPGSSCGDFNPKPRRLTMAQKALESRPRTSLAAAALSRK